MAVWCSMHKTQWWQQGGKYATEDRQSHEHGYSFGPQSLLLPGNLEGQRAPVTFQMLVGVGWDPFSLSKHWEYKIIGWNRDPAVLTWTLRRVNCILSKQQLQTPLVCPEASRQKSPSNRFQSSCHVQSYQPGKNWDCNQEHFGAHC